MLDRPPKLSLYAELLQDLLQPPLDEVEWAALDMRKQVECNVLVRQSLILGASIVRRNSNSLGLCFHNDNDQ